MGNKILSIGILAVTLILISLFSMSEFAAQPLISTQEHQMKFGVLAFVYYLTSSTFDSTTPSVNTAMTPPTGTGDNEILPDSSGYLWSTQFQNAWTTSQGECVLDFWAEGVAVEGSVTITIQATNSAGTVVGTLASGIDSGSLSLSGVEEVENTFSCSQVTIPAGGYLETVMTTPLLAAVILYWGAGQLTDFQIPAQILS
jgi:hypothetical protein